MLKRTVPALLCLLALSSPLTAFAADGDAQAGTGTAYPDNGGTVSVITVDGTSGNSGAVGRLYYPTEIRTIEDDGEKLIVKTFEVPAGVNPQILVEESFEKNGVLYEPREILKRSLPGSEETRLASTTVTVESKSKDMAELLKLLDPLVDYSEGGYTGQLLLDKDNIHTEAEGYTSYRYPVTEVREMSGMDRNDTYYIPKTASVNGMELTLNDVSWTTMGCGAANGRVVPNLFTAKAEYTGYATGKSATGYTVTATYTGQVSRKVEGDAIYSIVYGRAPGFEELLPSLDLSSEDKQFGALPYIIMACVIILGAAVTAVIIWVKRRGPIPAAEGPMPQEKQKKRIFMPRSMDPAGGEDGDE